MSTKTQKSCTINRDSYTYLGNYDGGMHIDPKEQTLFQLFDPELRDISFGLLWALAYEYE
jgi:hypothetical protein